MNIRCPHCHRFFGTPDLESVKTYAANGGIIQTLVQRIVAQPIHRHYHAPQRTMMAAAANTTLSAFAPAIMYWGNINPLLVAIVVLATGSILNVWANTSIEIQEVTDEPTGDEPEAEQDEPGPTLPVEVSHPYKNSTRIRMAHEPPRDPNPDRQRKLGQADLALAKLATSTAYPMNPISWAEARRRRYPHGEPTFYQIQKRWLDEGLAFPSSSGAVYLKPSGLRTLTQYATQ